MLMAHPLLTIISISNECAPHLLMANNWLSQRTQSAWTKEIKEF